MVGDKKVGVVIPAAGQGHRISGECSKQFLLLDGKSIFLHTIERFHSSPEIDVIVIVSDEEHLSTVRKSIDSDRLSKVCGIALGGMERQDSVWNGLNMLKNQDVQFVIVHDAVRPFVSQKLIHAVLSVLDIADAAVAAVRPKDTIKVSQDDCYILKTLRRESLWIIQTPQAFRFSLLKKAFDQAISDNFHGTDEASLVERLGVKVKIVPGSYDNIKITTPDDLELAKLILQHKKNTNGAD